MTNLELAKRLVELLGGKNNVEKATHCMTRLRVTCKDTTRVDDKAIKATEGVLGLVIDGSSYQIVLGPGKVKKVTDICTDELGLPKAAGNDSNWEENKAKIKGQQKQSKLKQFLKLISEIFVPIIPAIIQWLWEFIKPADCRWCSDWFILPDASIDLEFIGWRIP